MELELIECIYCHHKFYKNLEKLKHDGDAPVTRSIFSNQEQSSMDYLDIQCPVCKKTFEYEARI